MSKFIFTFGSGHELQGRYQIVVAENPMSAREKMVKEYGLEWGFQYTEEQWQLSLQEPYAKRYGLEKPLSNIII